MSQSASSCPANHAAHVEVLDLATRDQAFHVSCIGAVPRFTCELRRRCSSDCHLPLGPERDKATYKRMAETLGLESKIDAVQARINRVESKQERVESALEGNGSYLGTTDYVSLFQMPMGRCIHDQNRTSQLSREPGRCCRYEVPRTHLIAQLWEPHFWRSSFFYALFDRQIRIFTFPGRTHDEPSVPAEERGAAPGREADSASAARSVAEDETPCTCAPSW